MNYIVLKERKFPAAHMQVPISIVMCYLPERDEYVTWVRNDQNNTMGSGRYFTKEGDIMNRSVCRRQRAERDWHERVAAELRHQWNDLYGDEPLDHAIAMGNTEQRNETTTILE